MKEAELASRCLEVTYLLHTQGGARAKALVGNIPDCVGDSKEGRVARWRVGEGGVVSFGEGGSGPECWEQWK